jgi:hypothetical protein
LDLRGIELGDSCDKVVRVEEQLGSIPLYDVNEMRTDGILAFDVASRSLAISTEVLYDCSEQSGLVLHYTITVKTPDEVWALHAFDHAKDNIAAKVGAPNLDSNSLSGAQSEEFKRRARRVWIVRSVIWKTLPDETVSITLSHRKDLWRVTTSVGPKRLASDERSGVLGG